MEKRISIIFEEVKVVKIYIDLANVDNYISKFLALKNHQRNTPEILSVEGSNGSNIVEIVLLIDEDENEENEIIKCKDYAEQFGKITSYDVEKAWIVPRDWSLDEKLNYKDWYRYDK